MIEIVTVQNVRGKSRRNSLSTFNPTSLLLRDVKFITPLNPRSTIPKNIVM